MSVFCKEFAFLVCLNLALVHCSGDEQTFVFPEYDYKDTSKNVSFSIKLNDIVNI